MIKKRRFHLFRMESESCTKCTNIRLNYIFLDKYVPPKNVITDKMFENGKLCINLYPSQSCICLSV